MQPNDDKIGNSFLVLGAIWLICVALGFIFFVVKLFVEAEEMAATPWLVIYFLVIAIVSAIPGSLMLMIGIWKKDKTGSDEKEDL